MTWDEKVKALRGIDGANVTIDDYAVTGMAPYRYAKATVDPCPTDRASELAKVAVEIDGSATVHVFRGECYMTIAAVRDLTADEIGGLANGESRAVASWQLHTRIARSRQSAAREMARAENLRGELGRA